MWELFKKSSHTLKNFPTIYFIPCVPFLFYGRFRRADWAPTPNLPPFCFCRMRREQISLTPTRLDIIVSLPPRRTQTKERQHSYPPFGDAPYLRQIGRGRSRRGKDAPQSMRVRIDSSPSTALWRSLVTFCRHGQKVTYSHKNRCVNPLAIAQYRLFDNYFYFSIENSKKSCYNDSVTSSE